MRSMIKSVWNKEIAFNIKYVITFAVISAVILMVLSLIVCDITQFAGIMRNLNLLNVAIYIARRIANIEGDK